MVRAVLAVLAVTALTTATTMWVNRVGERWWQRRRIPPYQPRRYRTTGPPARTLNPARGSGPLQLPPAGPSDVTYPLPAPLPLPPPAVGRARVVRTIARRRGRNTRAY